MLFLIGQHCIKGWTTMLKYKVHQVQISNSKLSKVIPYMCVKS